MNWFKKKSYPQFWKDYSKKFNISKDHLDAIRFVVFDTETTGLNPKTDKILSIGCVAIVNLKIKISDQFEYYIEQDHFNAETVKIHGLLKEGKLSKVTEEQAIIDFLGYIENSVLVAHHAAFDVAMANESLKRMELPKLKNKVLDTGHLFAKTKLDRNKTHFSLDELANKFKIPLHDRHTASGDAYITALLFLKCIAILNKRGHLRLSDLTKPINSSGLI